MVSSEQHHWCWFGTILAVWWWVVSHLIIIIILLIILYLLHVNCYHSYSASRHLVCYKKLEHDGIRGVTNEWFSSYLKNRKQFVSIGNVSSTIKELLTGVPQGSVLGPLLFLLYINDLHNSVRYAKTYHFADDTSVILSSTSLEILSKRINKDLFNLSNWLKANKLSLNVKKTELVIFRSRKLKNSIRIQTRWQETYPN